MKIFLKLSLLISTIISFASCSVGFKKADPKLLTMRHPKERMLADSQQMLDAQDSRIPIYIFLIK